MQVISVQPITDRPIIDAIALEDFMLIGDVSDSSNVKRVLVSTLKAFFLSGLVLPPPPTPTPPPPPPPSGFALRINCGDGEYTDLQGNVWLADTFLQSGGFYSQQNKSVANGLVNAPLYIAESYAFTYSIPLPNGTYTLNMYFVELEINTRLFAVYANADLILDQFSIANRGVGVVVVKSATVVISNGILSLESVNRLNFSSTKINAIELIRSN